MVRKFGIVALCLTVCAFGLIAADEKKTPSIEDCMKFQGRNGLATKVAADAKADKWEDAQKKSAELKALGEGLGKNTPPMGSKDSWEKLTKKFAEQTAAVDTAAQAKKGDDVAKAVSALLDMKNCGACHSQHKPKK